MSMNPDILQKIDAIFDEYHRTDNDVLGLMMISTDGRSLSSTFNDAILIQRLAPLCTALHEIGNCLCEAYHRQDYAQLCWVKCEKHSLYSIPLNYGLVVADLKPSARLGGWFTFENLQQIAAYIDTLISTGQEPPPPTWKYGI